ncbi:hypothetical protein EBO15_29115 [Actinomadura harenae]|uniref:DUF320 domain-containing protein n=1 Tax=Actinomadura harenae TaxID=2483351 RepID=A0A3M2LXD6_9ACTN|nr:hypothetical protein EBO15_29115 [Actinomadura harenae]
MATGFMALAAGGVLMSASPAMAWDEPVPNIHSSHSSDAQGIGVQTCRSVEVGAVIGVILHNVLAQDNEAGNCNNGSTADSHHGHHGHGFGEGWGGYRH